MTQICVVTPRPPLSEIWVRGTCRRQLNGAGACPQGRIDHVHIDKMTCWWHCWHASPTSKPWIIKGRCRA